jgi:hypothetical protein
MALTRGVAFDEKSFLIDVIFFFCHGRFDWTVGGETEFGWQLAAGHAGLV